eukprot:2936619-Rhodomonas_salina.1
MCGQSPSSLVLPPVPESRLPAAGPPVASVCSAGGPHLGWGWPHPPSPAPESVCYVGGRPFQCPPPHRP